MAFVNENDTHLRATFLNTVFKNINQVASDANVTDSDKNIFLNSLPHFKTKSALTIDTTNSTNTVLKLTSIFSTALRDGDLIEVPIDRDMSSGFSINVNGTSYPVKVNNSSIGATSKGTVLILEKSGSDLNVIPYGAAPIIGAVDTIIKTDTEIGGLKLTSTGTAIIKKDYKNLKIANATAVDSNGFSMSYTLGGTSMVYYTVLVEYLAGGLNHTGMLFIKLKHTGSKPTNVSVMKAFTSSVDIEFRSTASGSIDAIDQITLSTGTIQNIYLIDFYSVTDATNVTIGKQSLSGSATSTMELVSGDDIPVSIPTIIDGNSVSEYTTDLVVNDNTDPKKYILLTGGSDSPTADDAIGICSRAANGSIASIVAITSSGLVYSKFGSGNWVQQFNPANTTVSLIQDMIRDGVSTDGDTLKKVYDKLVATSGKMTSFDFSKYVPLNGDSTKSFTAKSPTANDSAMTLGYAESTFIKKSTATISQVNGINARYYYNTAKTVGADSIGITLYSVTNTNTPTTDTYLIQQEIRDANNLMQIASFNGKMYLRRKASGTFSSWISLSNSPIEKYNTGVKKLSSFQLAKMYEDFDNTDMKYRRVKPGTDSRKVLVRETFGTYS